MAAWKLVSNDAKRTVAPPNAKHSTLLQGCFLCFLFLVPFTIRQQCRIYPQEFFHRTVVCYRFYQYLLFIQSLADAFLGCRKFVLLQPKKRRYIMKLVVGFLMSICHGVVDFVSCIGKLPRKLWRFNKKHHCITYDNNSIDSLYDWDDDDDF